MEGREGSWVRTGVLEVVDRVAEVQAVKLKRFRNERDVGSGWTRWVQPVKRGYLMSCCDCGLVHRMDFRIHEGRVQFRVQRAPMYTRRERARLK